MPGPPPVTSATQWAIELEDAVQKALAAWLASTAAGLGANGTTGQPAVAIFADWPEADVSLAMPHVTVLRSGEPDVEDLDPVITSAPPILVSGNIYTYTWLVGYATLPLQIDVWAKSKPQRGDVLARLRQALTQSPDVTLAAYIAVQGSLVPPNVIPLHDPVATEIILQLAPPWDYVLATYYFEKPRLHQAENVQLRDMAGQGGEREWRATLSGTATYEIVEPRNSPKLLAVTIQQTTQTTVIKPPPDECQPMAYDIAFSDSPWTVPQGNADVSIDTTGGDVVLKIANGVRDRETKTFRIRAGTHNAIVQAVTADLVISGNPTPQSSWSFSGPGNAVSLTWIALVSQWDSG